MASSTRSPAAIARANAPAGFLDGLLARPQRRPRGNPRWASPSAYSMNVPAQPSAWDRLLYRLGLAEDAIGNATGDAAALEQIQTGGPLAKQLTQWVRQNRGRFVPEAVLKELGEETDMYYGV